MRSPRRTPLAAAALLLSAAAFTAPALTAQTPSPSGPAAEALASYKRLETNILKAADKMPASDYPFRPTPDIRTFARVLNHVTEAQLHTCTTLNGTAFQASSVPADTADKDAVIAGLKASFTECDKAYSALSDGQLLEVLTMGPMKRTRIGLAWGNVAHDYEQYATLSIYLRLKGLVPPTSEK